MQIMIALSFDSFITYFSHQCKLKHLIAGLADAPDSASGHLTY
ncbi:hypothetical protein IWT140_00290 [Secundilactobacillus pentosiphilus]|uniref:Uncharacterized protein n=1 Tax=Secundilactobacillus pentosiphilus TaxID=1714682 RepID=A0A1Z5ILR7_9LACO|nr:hypothetical protein IWT140_00290 [Secundilactobacillus pentosiphilus]